MVREVSVGSAAPAVVPKDDGGAVVLGKMCQHVVGPAVPSNPVYIDGVLGDVQTPIGDDNVVVGIGGSGGVYEGPACVVRNFDDLFNVQQGDVLVRVDGDTGTVTILGA